MQMQPDNQPGGARSPWTPWLGGDCPVPAATAVIVVYRRMVGDAPDKAYGWAKDFDWHHAAAPAGADITSYMAVDAREQSARDAGRAQPTDYKKP